MSEKPPRNRKRNFETLAKKSVERVYDSAPMRLRYVYLPRAIALIYRNRWLRTTLNPRPRWAYLELTNKCNLRCKMCIYQATHRETGYTTRPQFESYLNQLSEIGLDFLCLHFGGESLLHPHFEDFLKYAIHLRDRGRIGRVGWVDNGMLFNQAMSDLVVSLRVDFVIFSIDGIGQVNDSIRLGSEYSIIEKNIKYLLKKRGTAKKPGVSLNMVDYGKNEEQKLEVYREWAHLVDEIVLLPSMLPDHTWENKNTLSQSLKTVPPPAFCHFPLNTIAISWDGKVTGCCQDYTFKNDLGDATKESIKQIWIGQKFQDLRKQLLTHATSKDSPCYKCEWWQVNFERRDEAILDGKAVMNYDSIIRTVRKS